MQLVTSYKKLNNEEKNGIELYFDNIPTYQERQQLKNEGYRWHNQKKCWYKKKGIRKTETKVINIKNYLGIKKGDIFYSSWGYEQTNVNFFEVIGLKGKTQVILQEVYLKIKEEDRIFEMSADRSYNTTKTYPVKNSCFVKDNEKGMVKKILGTKEQPYINLTSFANAYLYNGEKLYESWYY